MVCPLASGEANQAAGRRPFLSSRRRGFPVAGQRQNVRAARAARPGTIIAVMARATPSSYFLIATVCSCQGLGQKFRSAGRSSGDSHVTTKSNIRPRIAAVLQEDCKVARSSPGPSRRPELTVPVTRPCPRNLRPRSRDTAAGTRRGIRRRAGTCLSPRGRRRLRP